MLGAFPDVRRDFELNEKSLPTYPFLRYIARTDFETYWTSDSFETSSASTIITFDVTFIAKFHETDTFLYLVDP
jgi:hypothetical protein